MATDVPIRPLSGDALPATDKVCRLLITVHGIRTFGSWQEALEQKLRESSGERESIEVVHYRYGFFSILAFLMPPFRWLTTRRFRLELLHQVERKQWSRIDIVAHSFGTHLVGWGLLRIPEKRRPSIHTLIFAGSVLKSSFPVFELIGKHVLRLVNDCGIHDGVLVANQIFVLLTGMAGRVGFVGMQSDSFCNRYFNFGHSGYFKQERNKPDFMNEFWLPLLVTSVHITPHNDRPKSRFYDLTMLVLNNAEPIKLAVYILPILLALGYVNRLRIEAQEQTIIAKAQRDSAEKQTRKANSLRLVAQAQLNQASHPDRALLLGIEAANFEDSFETRNGLLWGLQRFPTLLFHVYHQSAVFSVALSPDGSLLASAGADKTVRLWHVATGRPLGVPLNSASSGVPIATFSPDGKLLASAAEEGTVKLWDVATQQPSGVLQDGASAVFCLAFSPDGSLLASATRDGSVKLWDVSSRRLVGDPLVKQLMFFDPQHRPSFVTGIAFSPNGKVLAAASADKSVQVWDVASHKQIGDPLQTGSPVRGPYSSGVNSVAFSPDGRLLAYPSDANSIQLWDITTGQLSGEKLGGHTSYVSGVAFSRDGKLLASASGDRTVRIWDVEKRQLVGDPLLGHADGVTSVAFGSDYHLASASLDGTARMWDIGTMRTSIPLEGHTDRVFRAVFSPDGKLVASASADSTVRLWDVSTRQAVGELQTDTSDGVSSVAFSPDGKLIAAGVGKTVWFWNVASRQPSGPPLQGHGDKVLSLAFSPDGMLLATASADQTLGIWNLATRQPRGEWFRGHKGYVFSVKFSPNGKLLASSSNDRTVRLWDVETHQPLGLPLPILTDGYEVAFSPDNRLLAWSGGEPNTWLWDVATGRSFNPLTSHDTILGAVAFSPDGKMLASSSPDGALRLWDVATGEQVGQPLQGHTGIVWSVAFSPDGTRLASAGADKIVRLWAVGPKEWIFQTCRIVNRNLFGYEWKQYMGTDVKYRQTCQWLPREDELR